MMFKGKSIYNASFNIFAENYHSVRPGYPKQLFVDIQELCGLGKDSRMLEIGAGSGIATKELANLGGYILAIEPGERLADIARQQTAEFDNVEIVVGTFENFHAQGKFDAVLAFTAYHWIDEGVRYQRVQDLLTDDGCLVLAWNSFFQSDTLATIEVNRAYSEMLPDVYPKASIVADVNQGVLAKLNGREQEILANPMFYPVYTRKYLTTYNYDDQTYPKLLNTFPKIVAVADERRMGFFQHIAEIVKRHGKISVPVLTTLIVCRKKASFLEVVSKP